MTDEKASTALTPRPEALEFLERYQSFEARAAELQPVNKAALFSALKACDIAKIIVRFDGYGDSGQIEEVTAFLADDQECALPDEPVELQKFQFGEEAPLAVRTSLTEAIDAIAYAYLASTHSGWENNEGAFGQFLFDVSAGTVTLDYNERYETSENFSHEF